ncbi:hypothetical protein [Neorhizobium sp. NCHU2750]|uniref:hypothetical protein n=1 Tax=Neorhizobium sp. NCHU2750 TaxID=1825976 RepID=UPI0013C4BD25
MLKGAWLLPAAMLVALILVALPATVFAADSNPFGKSMNSYFKDLPGVAPQTGAQASKPDDYSCTSDIGYVSRYGGRYYGLGWHDVPVRLYHCKAANGAIYTGTHMPNTQWVPGLNPKFLPE